MDVEAPDEALEDPEASAKQPDQLAQPQGGEEHVEDGNPAQQLGESHAGMCCRQLAQNHA